MSEQAIVSAKAAAAAIERSAKVRSNVIEAVLYEDSLRRGEGVVTASGALVADTGKHTGRSPKDKFTLRDAVTEKTVWWGRENQPIDQENFDRLLADFVASDAFRSAPALPVMTGNP